jgi:hypothetical protein
VTCRSSTSEPEEPHSIADHRPEPEPEKLSRECRHTAHECTAPSKHSQPVEHPAAEHIQSTGLGPEEQWPGAGAEFGSSIPPH